LSKTKWNNLTEISGCEFLKLSASCSYLSSNLISTVSNSHT